MLLFCLMADASGSMKSAKRSEHNNRHPCLVPISRLNDLDIFPLKVTNADCVLYKILIQLIKCGPGLNSFKDVLRKGQPTL